MDHTDSPASAAGAEPTSTSAKGSSPNSQPSVTFRQMLAEVHRELAMRTRLYPGWVTAKRMTQAVADRQINVMVAMAEHFAPLADAERDAAVIEKEAAEPSLF